MLGTPIIRGLLTRGQPQACQSTIAIVAQMRLGILGVEVSYLFQNFVICFFGFSRFFKRYTKEYFSYLKLVKHMY